MTEPKLPEPVALAPALEPEVVELEVEPEVEPVAPKPPVITVTQPGRQPIVIDRAAEAAIARAIRAAGG